MAFPRKIGVLTFHRSINYGSYWQARCLVEGLRARGHQAELLDHGCRCIRRAEVRCALQPELPRRTPRTLLKSYAAKTRKFADAVAGLPLSRPFSLHEPERAGDYDVIVVGSDEVWNFHHPWYGSKPIFFGERLKAGRLVSYAASFGNHSAWDGIHPEWARKLDRFERISVRDRNSWHLVRGGSGREPSLVLDPCLQFADFARQAQAGGRCAVVYGHGFPAWLKRRIRDWADRRKLELVSVGYRNEWADRELVTAGPVEFAGIMGGARAVITNFFHGCVFALLNRKPWVSCPSDYRAIKIPDLASTLGAEHRLIEEGTSAGTIGELLEMPVEAEVSARIEALRARSDSYLDEALS
ncbi:MAG: polysaccharide pyruvyl transferase family protein [Sphingomicrobium sp.]